MQYRRLIIKLATFLGGLYFFLEYVLPLNRMGAFGAAVEANHSVISNGFITVGAMAVGLGLINILMVHGARIVFKRKGFLNSVALLTGLFLMMLITALDWRSSQGTSDKSAQIAMLRDFTGVIQSDHEAKRENIPPLPVRFEKYIAALKVELAAVAEDIKQLEQLKVPEAHVKFNKLEQQRAALSRALEQANGELQMIEGSFNPDAPDFAKLAGMKNILAELGALRSEALTLAYEFSHVRGMYNLLFNGLFEALGAAMFSMLGFYIAAAAYRAFRIRSPESALMMLAAILVMLGQISFGSYISALMPEGWGLTEIRLFLLQVPNAAAFRAIQIGAAVGFVVMAFRMWLSIESESFGERAE